MEDMAARHADRAVRSIFVYTREAHPGENYPHLTSMEQKRRHARAMRDTLGFKRQMLIDDLEGTVHRAYGTLPNMTWIVGRGGIIHYKAAWTNVADVEAALKDSLYAMDNRAKLGLMPFYAERISWRTREQGFRAGLERAGPKAVSDFFGKPLPKTPPGALDEG
jgi:hypothetical protein